MRSDGIAKPYVRSDSLMMKFQLNSFGCGGNRFSAKCSAYLPSNFLRDNSQWELLRMLGSGKRDREAIHAEWFFNNEVSVNSFGCGVCGGNRCVCKMFGMYSFRPFAGQFRIGYSIVGCCLHSYHHGPIAVPLDFPALAIGTADTHTCETQSIRCSCQV